MIRRRWLAGSLVEELTLRNPHPLPVSVHLELEVAADFAHVFDVKSGTSDEEPAQAGGRLAGTVDAALAPRRAGPHRGGAATGAGRGRRCSRYRGLAPEHPGRDEVKVVGHRAARLGRRPRRARASVRAGPRGGDPRPAGLAVDRTDRGLARPPPARRRRPGPGRPGRLAHRRPGAPGPRRRRRRGAVVHDAVRSRLVADRLDDAALRRLARRRGAGQPGRPPGPRGRPGVRGAAGPHPARAAPARRQRRLLLPQPLLRHGRRDAALRRADGRGVAVAGDRRGHAPRPGAGRRSRHRLDHRPGRLRRRRVRRLPPS